MATKQYRKFFEINCEICKKKLTRRVDAREQSHFCRGCAVRTNMTIHGDSYTRLYKIWENMKNRCTNLKDKNYGGRGITFTSEWKTYIPFKNWAMSHGYDEILTLDRIDVNGNYCPENCRWATKSQQASNKRPRSKKVEVA